MALQTTLTIQLVMVGQGDLSEPTQQIVNANAPPSTSATLQIGNNTILVPAGFTVNGAWLKPPPNSVNAKIIKGVNGDTGLSGWTAAPMAVPAVAGGSIVVNSAGVETIEVFFY